MSERFLLSPNLCRHLYVYGVPRGGSNLFCSLLHNHDNIAAINHATTTRLMHAMYGRGKTGQEMINRFDLIYPTGGFLKDVQKVTHIAFDKVHWVPKSGNSYVDLSQRIVDRGEADGIVLVRHPLAVLSSMEKFHRKYGRPEWSLTRPGAASFLQRYFLPQLLLLKQSKTVGVVIEEFVQDLQANYSSLCREVGLPFHPRFADFETTFKLSRTWSGSCFEVHKREIPLHGSFFSSKAMKAPVQHVYCDPKTDELTIGYGMFNPIKAIDYSRLIEYRGTIDWNTEGALRDVFLKSMSANDVTYLFESEILDIQRLKNFDVRKTANFGTLPYLFFRWRHSALSHVFNLKTKLKLVKE